MNYRVAIAVTLVRLSPLAVAQLQVSPASLTFPTQALATTSAKQQVNVTNNSSTPVSFSSIQTTGDFAVASSTCVLKTALAAGASCYLRVGFAPTAAGARTGTLTLADSDPSSPHKISLQGVGSAVGLAPASVSFATQLLDTTSTATPVVLTNAGTTALTITAIAITAEFQVRSQNCIPAGKSTGTVGAGASCTINIVFAPSTVGKRTGTLTVSDNSGTGTQRVALTGTATAGALSTSSLAFGQQHVHLPSGVQVVSLSNVSSTASVNLTGISLSPADYTQVSSCIPAGASSGKVLPGGACAIYVTFTPSSVGLRSGTMTITTNSSQVTRLSVTLSGTGVAGVGIALSPVVAAITNTMVLPLTATVTNTSNNNVTWTVDNGIANGSSTVGTITVTGPNTATYHPPQSDGQHTVTATSVASATSRASMKITVTDCPGTFTYHNDNARDGQNPQEIALNPSNVNVAQFGKLFSYAVDGQVYAQPLYVANRTIPGKGSHNVLYVATEHDSVYAFDADGLTSTPLWQVSFLSEGQNATPVPSTAINANYDDLTPEIGITGTPVIDASAGTLFVVAKTYDNGSTYTQRLHALDLDTGQEQPNSPVVISSSITTDGKTKVFNALLENQRAALLLLNGVVYIAWGSHGDIGSYHGWVMGYSETTLAQVSAFITTPVDTYGGIWQAGGGPAADASGNIYVTAGNGPDDAATGGSDYSGAFIKLGTTSGLEVADYFKPPKTTDNSYEMSSGGPVVVFPDQAGSFKHVAIVAGKDKNLYLVNRDNMGGTSPSSSQLLQTIFGAFRGGVFSTPSVWQNNAYFWAETDYLRSFQLANGQLTPTATYPLGMAYPGAGTAVSSNGNQNGILWALDAKAILHAFDATNVSHEFYNSSEAGTRDNAGTAVKFAVPTVVNGKVYFGSVNPGNGANQVSGYGLLKQTRTK